MPKLAVSTLLAAPSILAGACYIASIPSVQQLDYKLVDDEALVIIPVDNPAYADAAANLYLQASGFTIDPGYSNVATLDMPEVTSGGTLNDAVNYGVSELVGKIEAEYTAGDFSSTDPLYVFGYSQSSVVMGMAEQQLYDDHIPQDALHLVMVGDSASAEGGFLNSFLAEFPASWQQSIIDLFKDFGADEVLGQVTPTGLYSTDVYSLSGDGWSIYDNGLNNAGLFSDHLEYLGLTPTEIASAGAPVTDGMGQFATEYFTIQDSMVNSLEALLTQLQIADSILF
jgi:hypothetical protein